uniref:Uncharacterized protein n=1 Tax=Lotus japonicus TaxID=34305 RepID=I3SIG6_LOTJA|nr:unknown [Lotus japonicus]
MLSTEYSQWWLRLVCLETNSWDDVVVALTFWPLPPSSPGARLLGGEINCSCILFLGVGDNLSFSKLY